MFKVGIIGPESTGKSSLGQYLAKRYGATYVPEYARDYVASLHRPYTYDDVCHIARTQIAQIKAVDSGQWAVGSGQWSNSKAVKQRSGQTAKRSNNEVV